MINYSLVGLLNLPRTIVTMILPSIIGVWIAKKYTNQYKAIALAAGIVAIACAPFISINPATPILLMFIAQGLTGLAESFRAVSITPVAQYTLSPEELSSGTALINFFNTLASVLAASLSGCAYNIGLPDINQGISNVYLLITVISLIGFLIAILYIRPKHIARYKAENNF